LPVDTGEYGIGAQLVLDLGVRRIRLLTNNPRKMRGLDRFGLELVERVPLPPRTTRENLAYLHTKRARMGHLLDARPPG